MQIRLKKINNKLLKINKQVCRVSIKETVNNMFVVVSKSNGQTIYKASIGFSCKRLELESWKTPLSCELLGNFILKIIIEKGFKLYVLIISKAFTKLVRSVLKRFNGGSERIKTKKIPSKIS